jgi:hypothetical protein
MTERSLHQVNGRPAVERMRSVGVAEPVWRDWKINAGAAGRLAYDPENGKGLQHAAILPLAGTEKGVARLGAGAPQNR